MRVSWVSKKVRLLIGTPDDTEKGRGGEVG
jgi:hypothetical protein